MRSRVFSVRQIPYHGWVPAAKAAVQKTDAPRRAAYIAALSPRCPCLPGPFADRRDVGRTNQLLLFFGLGACLALSLMMHHLVEVKKDNSIEPIVSEITKFFGKRLTEPSRYRVTRQNGQKVGFVMIFPMLGIDEVGLVQDVGGLVWRQNGPRQRLAALMIVADTGFDDPTRFQARSPWSTGPRLIRLENDEDVKFYFEAVPKPKRKVSAAAPPQTR